MARGTASKPLSSAQKRLVGKRMRRFSAGRLRDDDDVVIEDRSDALRKAHDGMKRGGRTFGGGSKRTAVAKPKSRTTRYI